jgi:hypothetical protein
MGASDHTDQPIIVVDQETRRSGARRVDKVKLEQRGRCCGLNGGPVDVRFGNERAGSKRTPRNRSGRSIKERASSDQEDERRDNCYETELPSQCNISVAYLDGRAPSGSLPVLKDSVAAERIDHGRAEAFD